MRFVSLSLFFSSALVAVDSAPRHKTHGPPSGRRGNNSFLQNAGANGSLNSARNEETPAQRNQRLNGETPEDLIDPEYDPLLDAVCFTDPIYEPEEPNPIELYNDYVTVFDFGFNFPTDTSEENNNVTGDRFAGMMLRMCFHDNAIIPSEPPFPHYVEESLRVAGPRLLWKGPSRYLSTSGSDASVLVCAEERFHPNQNYDQTASRVLIAFQSSRFFDDGSSMKSKYELSYADLLHNGCIAATIYTTRQDPEAVLAINPFVFGRRDACHTRTASANKVAQVHTRFPLCGPTEILPGVNDSIESINNWFLDRGMSECFWLAQMWTHTTMDNMADECPLRYLPCESTEEMVDKVEYVDQAGIELDYWDFFLVPGEHDPFDEEEITDPEGSNCDWSINSEDKFWPLTRADCTIALDQAVLFGQQGMVTAINNFHTAPKDASIDALLCSYRMMASDGSDPGGACDFAICDEAVDEHYFGAYFA